MHVSSVVSNSVIPWTVACQAPLSMRFPRQQYWSGFPYPPPRDLPNPGIKPASLVSPALAGGFFITVPPGKPNSSCNNLAYRAPYLFLLKTLFFFRVVLCP